MNTPRITVLMPVYNAAPFLREAVDSILQQTFRDFEFLIIDDGSTDDSAAIIESYTDPRIRFILNDGNIGISATLNRGIALAACELIARMDADDISYPARLQKQYDYMVAHPACGMVSSWCRVITADKKNVRTERYTSRFFYYNLTFECWIYHPTVMYRKQAVIDVGMYSMPYSEDYDLFWKLAQKFPVNNLSEILLDYRLSPNSLNTVLRKTEYDIANEQNVIRNIQRYMGETFTLQEEYLECLRNNTAPLAAKKSIPDILQCLSILDTITAQIARTENINCRPIDIYEAAWFKRDFIVYQLFQQLSWPHNVVLSLKTGKPGLVFRKVSQALQWRTKKIWHHLRMTGKRSNLI
ncbi:glycosyltransferase family 2 protein [Ohtaekwangia sp.]|uniref:glycosyltransferase family 2 protein n=1 Tax=Ohtaekwangia sp. TaxID=2066019 RepID=UPI002F95EA8B